MLLLVAAVWKATQIFSLCPCWVGGDIFAEDILAGFYDSNSLFEGSDLLLRPDLGFV